jgi:hemerythrin-like metal-binding protein
MFGTIIWNEKWSIGIEEIDSQHKKLFELLNSYYKNLVDSKTTGVTNDVIKDTINHLVDYTTYHFVEEEKLMNSIQGVDFSEHFAEHQDFCSKIATFKVKMFLGNNVSFELFNFIKNWLINHILASDQQISKVLQRKTTI